tara:strand:+ start:630 stop:1703 length:1074 start_codon:yes stop_codon:yes gene_type:complete
MQGAAAQAAAFSQLGKTAASAIEKFREGKEKKEREEDFKAMGQRLYKSNPEAFSAFGVTSEDEANAFLDAVKKDPEQMQSAIQFAALSQQSQARKGQQEVANIFLQSQGPTYSDQYGTFDRATGQPAVDRFSGDPRAFLRSIEQSGQMPQTPQGRGQLAGLVQQMAQGDAAARRQADLAAAGRIPTQKDLLETEKLRRQLDEGQGSKVEAMMTQKETYDKVDGFLNAIEDGMDVTGPIEGQPFVRWLSNVAGDDDVPMQRDLEILTNALVLEGAQKMKGNLSDKDIRFLQATVPQMTDKPEVWKKWLTDFKQKLLSHAAVKGVDLTGTQEASTEASQESLTELERLRKLRQQRAAIR